MEARLPFGPEDVTDRQRQVAHLIAQEKTNRQIAEALGISLDGAKYHVSELLGRLGLERREDVGAWYRTHFGWRTRLRGLLAVPFGTLLLGGGATAAATVVVIVTVVVLSSRSGADGGGLIEFDLPAEAQRFTLSAPVVLPDGRIFVAAGFFGQDGNTDGPDAWILDPSAREWQALPVDDTGVQPRAVMLSDGRLAVSGGVGNGPRPTQLTYIEPGALTAEVDTFHLHAPPSALAATSDGGVAYITQPDPEDPPRMYTYRPGSNRNLPAGEADVGEIDNGLTLHALPDDRFAVVGMEAVVVLGRDGVEQRIELPSAIRVAHPATTLMADGRLLIAGGFDPEESALFQHAIREQGQRLLDARRMGEPTPAVTVDSPASTRVLVVDLRSGRVQELDALPAPRILHTLLPMEDGRVLVVGGITRMVMSTGARPNIVAGPVIYDPATGQSEAVEIPLEFVYSGTPLGDGRFFLIGADIPDSPDEPVNGHAIIWQP